MVEQHKHKHGNKERRPTAEILADSVEYREKTPQTLEQAEKHHRSNQLEHEALATAAELAEKADSSKSRENHADRPIERHRGAPSKKQLKGSFDSEMMHVRKEMNVTDRIVSKIIHNRFVEKSSEVLSSTLARPNSMLSGSIAAFICITIVYFVARHYGYKLSGFETIAAFVFGWGLGLLYDYFVEHIRNRKL